MILIFLIFFNDTCVYAFAECWEARDFVSQEMCSHARAGVLAWQCVCFSSSLSLTYVPLFSYPLLCDVCLLLRLTLFVACTPGKLWVSASSFFSPTHMYVLILDSKSRWIEHVSYFARPPPESVRAFFVCVSYQQRLCLNWCQTKIVLFVVVFCIWWRWYPRNLYFAHILKSRCDHSNKEINGYKNVWEFLKSAIL